MPLLVGFGLVALFIWFAENLGTFAGAWLYPHQRGGWSMVPPAKFGAWFLLMLLSYALVFALHAGKGAVRAPPQRAKISSRPAARLCHPAADARSLRAAPPPGLPDAVAGQPRRQYRAVDAEHRRGLDDDQRSTRRR